ncbi:MAG: ABC transporter permease subunit [Ignavibacteriae bacterium]|nr:ABC transporter permease subunit [Ignavibacteriota bacterium]
MAVYILRRLLLAIPTFFGCTLVVFVIVQLAPGGPLEEELRALKMGGGGEGAVVSQTAGSVTQLPQDVVDAMKEFYGFDEPLWKRYPIWLGIYPRKVDRFVVQPGVPRNIGEGKKIVVKQTGTQLIITDAETNQTVSGWSVRFYKNDKGEDKIQIYKEKFSGILTLDFGKSHKYNEPVLNLIKSRLPVSIQFGIISLILTYTFCVYLGIQKAIKHGSPFDFASSAIVFVGYSIPGWALGAVMLVALGGGSGIGWFPLGGFQGPDYDQLTFLSKIGDRIYYFVLPTIAYCIAAFATTTILMKNSLLENLSQDYIRTAFAKGLKERRVIWVHAMRNSIIPLAANFGSIIGIFLASNYLIERVFNIQGIGKLSFEALLSRDYSILFTFTVLTTIVSLLGALISDMILATVDPRIRFK